MSPMGTSSSDVAATSGIRGLKGATCIQQALDLRPSSPAIAIVVALIVEGFLLANLLSFGYGRDQGIYAVVGHAITLGGVPYRDAWDFKPPGIHFLFALARSSLGPAPWAIRVVEAACWAT